MFTQYSQQQLKRSYDSSGNCSFTGYQPSGTMEVQTNYATQQFGDFVSGNNKDVKEERRRSKKEKVEQKEQTTTRKQNPGVYTCQTCNALFTCLEYYQQHRRHHAESNGIKLLTCNHCTFSSDNAFHFNWHVMTHTNEDKHSCQVCAKPQLTTSGTSPMKQDCLDGSSSISDDDPLSCSMIGKRSVATATTDDLFLLSSGNNSNCNSNSTQSSQQTINSSCRMASKGINVCLSSSLDSDLINLKTIDTSDLIDTDEYEEDEDGDDEEEEQQNGDNEDEEEEEEDEEDEEEEDDDDDDDDDEEEDEEDDENDKDYQVPIATKSHQQNKKSKQENLDSSSQLIEINLVSSGGTITMTNTTDTSTNNTGNNATTNSKGKTGRGKGNRKSRVTNSFLDGSDGALGPGEILRRKFHCSHCGKSFKTKSHLQRHILTHTGEKPYHCNRCGSKFNQSSSLRNHIIAIHTKEYPHYCPTCGKGFLMPALLQKHLSTSHRDTK